MDYAFIKRMVQEAGGRGEERERERNTKKITSG